MDSDVIPPPAGAILSPRAEAQANQRAASNPAVSAFVAASAGSGKTRLLTDRLLRLMVGGAKPDRILCLTFTKAAAAEMAVRLQRRLGQWVTLEHRALEAELRALDIPPTPDTMTLARSLFAHVLDLPGGMRIGTIHGFCQSLLRRFPLEAALSPHFRLVDDRDAEEAMTEARENLLARAREHGLTEHLGALAGLASLSRFGVLVNALKAGRGRWHQARAPGGDPAAARRRVLGVKARDRNALLAAAVAWKKEAALRAAAATVARKGSDAIKVKAATMLAWLDRPVSTRAADWETWRDLFLKADGEPRAGGAFVNKKLGDSDPPLVEALLAEAVRVHAVEDDARAIEVALLSEALVQLAGPLLDVLNRTLAARHLLPVRDGAQLAQRLAAHPNKVFTYDGVERGIPRNADREGQKEEYSAKKKFTP